MNRMFGFYQDEKKFNLEILRETITREVEEYLDLCQKRQKQSSQNENKAYFNGTTIELNESQLL